MCHVNFIAENLIVKTYVWLEKGKKWEALEMFGLTCVSKMLIRFLPFFVLDWGAISRQNGGIYKGVSEKCAWFKRHLRGLTSATSEHCNSPCNVRWRTSLSQGIFIKRKLNRQYMQREKEMVFSNVNYRVRSWRGFQGELGGGFYTIWLQLREGG